MKQAAENSGKDYALFIPLFLFPAQFSCGMVFMLFSV
jgi:hypothetical protein